MPLILNSGPAVDPVTLEEVKEHIDPTFAPIIFAAEPETDWRNEDAWHAANPAIDAGFCSIDELRIKARRIEHFPAEIADFRRFHLNQWQEGAANPWLALEVYDAAEDKTPVEDLTGQPCWAGSMAPLPPRWLWAASWRTK